MAAYEYSTDVITHGFMGRKEAEIDREELETRLNQHGAEGWELDRILMDVALHREKDGHLLIFKRSAA
jgi:hypothetical protein